MSRVPDNLIVVFDEAVFSNSSMIRLTRFDLFATGRNVVVLRTFSKIHGLAGGSHRIRHRAAGDDRSASQDEAAIQRQQHCSRRRDRGAR
jgi:hypothetical protein